MFSATLLRLLGAGLALAFPLPALAGEPLPGTKPLDEKGDLARIMVDGIHKYLDRELAAAAKKREELWKPDLKSQETLTKSLPAKRDRLKKLLGIVDERTKPNLEYISGPGKPSLMAEFEGCKVHAVRWSVLPGVDAEGFLIEPQGAAKANVIAVPHADQLPEQLAGLIPGDDFAMRLAQQGCRVLIPTLIDRNDDLSGNPRLKRQTNLPHREFIYRMTYEMGRSLIGLETQKVLAGVDWFTSTEPKLKIGVIGYGDGGLMALYAGALDSRIAAIGIGGAISPIESLHLQPIDRNRWAIATEFGDAECLLMIGSNRLALDLTLRGPVWAGPNTKSGRGGAAPGTLKANTEATQEVERFKKLERLLKAEEKKAVEEVAQKETTLFALTEFVAKLGLTEVAMPIQEQIKRDSTHLQKLKSEASARHARQFQQLVNYSQKLWRDSDATRKEFWKKADSSSVAKWEQSTEEYRDYFHREVIGKLPEPTKPLNVRTRQTYDEKNWTGHEVAMDVYDDVIAYGILLLPKDLKPGEKRPVVVCQHGLEGRPQDIVNPKEISKYYNSYGARLADLGYVVYAPQNPYIFQNHFRQIQRKANPLKLSLFSFINRQHQRTLDWLETLPQVDAKKIAFYGLSYGGKTAMRVPAVEKRYCLSICSGDFNEWIGKNVSVDLDRSYLWTGEYEMYEFDLGNTCNYAEMAYLIAPRPFMVERGHDDGVGIDEMIAYEFARVRYLFANKLKLPDRATIEFQPGGHEIFLKGTLRFLEQHIGKARQ